ncbi:MAG: beta-ketoacyl-ACP synthase II [Bacilli bacterium]
MEKRRVVVTGLGGVTPVGNDVETIWSNIKNGISGIGEITKFDTTDYKVKLAAEVKDFDPEKYLDYKSIKRYDLFSIYAMYASAQAYEDSGLGEDIDKNRMATVYGSGIGGLKTIEDNIVKVHEKGVKRLSPLFIPTSISNMAAGNIAIMLGAKGSCTATTTACAAGTHAVIDGFRVIVDNRADIAIVGGSEAPITPCGIGGFMNMTALSTSTDPSRASIPFDKERDGFVAGEGAVTLILEELEHAKARGAKIYAEVIGYGSTCDAFHITSPDFKGGARCMDEAITTSGLSAVDIDYINAHGTSTGPNDLNETLAIKEVFGDDTKVLVSSTKSMTGHLLGGAGAIEALICVKALQDQVAPPTINYKVADEELDLDYVANSARDTKLEYVMSNSLGFGGHNASVILKRWNNE